MKTTSEVPIRTEHRIMNLQCTREQYRHDVVLPFKVSYLHHLAVCYALLHPNTSTSPTIVGKIRFVRNIGNRSTLLSRTLRVDSVSRWRSSNNDTKLRHLIAP